MKKTKKYTYIVSLDLYDFCSFKINKKEKNKTKVNYPFDNLSEAIRYAVANIDQRINENMAEAEDLENEVEEMELNKQKLLKKLAKLKEKT